MLQASETDSFFADPPTYTLYITASLSPETRAIFFLRKSPRATLGRFVGFKEDGCAPDWTRWTRPTLEFQQPKATFAELFVRMATWEVNALQVCGLYESIISCGPSLTFFSQKCTGQCRVGSWMASCFSNRSVFLLLPSLTASFCKLVAAV